MMAVFEGDGNVIEAQPLGAGATKESFDRMEHQSAAMLQAAENGEFAVHPDDVDKLAEPYEKMLDRLNGPMRFAVRRLAQRPKLGDVPYAQQVAEFNQRWADPGDAKSIGHAIDQLVVVCENAAEAYRRAAENYRAADADADLILGDVKGSLDT